MIYAVECSAATKSRWLDSCIVKFIHQVFSEESLPSEANGLSHNVDTDGFQRKTARDYFETLEDWQKEVMNDTLRPSKSSIPSAFKRYGYSFGMLSA